MASEQSLSREVTSLLEALPHDQLYKMTRDAVLKWLEATSRAWSPNVPVEELLKSVLPELPEAQIPAVAREIALSTFRNSCWNQILSLPGQWNVEVRCLTPASAQALRERKGPAIIAFWHHGATDMVAMGLQAIGVPAVIVGSRQPHDWFWRTKLPETKFVSSSDTVQSAIALKAALDRLKEGGVVVMAVDGRKGLNEMTVPLLGYRIQIAKGIGVLARLTGASIIPALVTWGNGDWSIDFRIFDALQLPPLASMKADDWDREVVARAVRFFEAILRAYPGQWRLDRLVGLANHPRLETAPPIVEISETNG